MTLLREFLQQEMRIRKLDSARDFAEFVGVSHTTINRIMSDTKDEFFPSVAFLKKLALATHTDICVLMAMVVPEATLVEPDAALLAGRIARLPRPQREMLDTMIIGLAFKHGN